LLTSIAESRKHLTDIANVVVLVSGAIWIAQERLLGHTQYPLVCAKNGDWESLALRNGFGDGSQGGHWERLQAHVGGSIVRDRIDDGTKQSTPRFIE